MYLTATLPTVVAGQKAEVVVGKNGDFYIYNPFSQLDTKTWLKGTIDSDGNVTIPTPQYIYREVDGTQIHDLYAVRMKPSEIPGDYNFEKDEEESDLKFIWKDNVLTQVGDGILGLAYIDGEFRGYADSNIKIEPFTGVIVAPGNPDELTFNDYIIGYSTHYETPSATMAKLAFDDDEVWLTGFSKDLPDAWIHGTYDGTSIIFESNQYLGLYDGMYYAYFYGATAYVGQNEQGTPETMYRLDDILICEENSKKGYSSEDVFLINSGNRESKYLFVLSRPDINPYETKERYPMLPNITGFTQINPSEQIGLGQFSFALDPIDCYGNEFLDPEKLFYTIYVNDESNPLILKKSQFPKWVSEDTSEIPYSFSDGVQEWTIMPFFNEFNLLFMDSSWTRIGVKAIYKEGGKSLETPVAWSNEPAPNWPEVSVESIVADTEGDAEYYDLTGRRVENPSNGIFIVKFANGKVAKKVIR